jgi:hypothetical protein
MHQAAVNLIMQYRLSSNRHKHIFITIVDVKWHDYKGSKFILFEAFYKITRHPILSTGSEAFRLASKLEEKIRKRLFQYYDRYADIQLRFMGEEQKAA